MIRAELTDTAGNTLAFSPSSLLSVSVETGVDSAIMPGDIIGSALTAVVYAPNAVPSAWRGGELVTDMPDGRIRFIVESVCGDTIRDCYRITATDALSVRLGETFSDTLRYPATLQALWAEWARQTGRAAEGEPKDVPIPTMPEWEDATLRRVGGWIAQACGAYIDCADGETARLVPFNRAAETCVSASRCGKYRDGYRPFGPVGRLCVEERDGTVRTQIGEGDTVSYTAQPLLDAMGESALSAAAENVFGAMWGRLDAEWTGGERPRPGDMLTVTDAWGGTHTGRVNRVTLRFDGAIRCTCECAVPEERTGRALTKDGRVNASALVGRLSGALLEAGSVGTAALADGAVTAEKLSAAVVLNPSAQAVARYLNALTEEEMDTDILVLALRRVLKERG